MRNEDRLHLEDIIMDIEMDVLDQYYWNVEKLAKTDKEAEDLEKSCMEMQSILESILYDDRIDIDDIRKISMKTRNGSNSDLVIDICDNVYRDYVECMAL